MRLVFVISDSIGETADRMVQAALTQFTENRTEVRRYSHVQTPEKLERIVAEAEAEGAVVAYTLVLGELQQKMRTLTEKTSVPSVDLLDPLLTMLSDSFNEQPKKEPGRIRQLDEAYFRRIEAVEFAVKYDDAQDTSGLKKADLVLIGVSRTSKTPLSMYLAHKQFKVANVPLVPEVSVPDELYELPRERCIGLVISPSKLNDIRRIRLRTMGLTEKADYASLDRILKELEYAEKIMKRVGCPVIDVSNKAVEETASYILEVLKLERRHIS